MMGSKGAMQTEMMAAKVSRERDRVWIDGVAGWSFGEMESSVHAAQARVIQAVDEDVRYEHLVGVSGLAFRMQVTKDALCPSSPHARCGYKCVRRSRASVPWRVRVYEVKADDAAGVSEARRAVVTSIDRGLPVQYGSEEDGVIAGYERGGEAWVCFHPMHEGGHALFVETKWPWGIAVYTERKDTVPSRRTLALGALEQAVEMAKTIEADDYYVGFRAWDAYIERLEALEEAEDATREEAMLGNWWIYQCLAAYRRAAADYLHTVAGDFGLPAAKHMTKAADLYEKMSSEVLTGDKGALEVAPFPWSLKEGETWTTAMREDQVGRLRAALPLEREAIGELEAALATAGNHRGD